MLSDEMTTGSVTSSDSHKRLFAAKSHSWNISQPKFREAFPDVSAGCHCGVVLIGARRFSSAHPRHGISRTWAKRRKAYLILLSLTHHHCHPHLPIRSGPTLIPRLPSHGRPLSMQVAIQTEVGKLTEAVVGLRCGRRWYGISGDGEH